MEEQTVDQGKPVDGYVSMLLEQYSEETSTEIDVKSPTREQRIEAALFFDGKGEQWSAVEIMVGKRVDSSSEEARTYGFLITAQAMCPDTPRRFYEGFPETE